MKSNNEILDEFGQIIVNDVFENQYRFILNKTEDLALTEGYEELFSKMDANQKKEIENYTKELLSGALFDFLKMFEENEQFKIIFEKDNQQVDLNKISEMLKSEPIIENGWIDRFSELIDKTST